MTIGAMFLLAVTVLNVNKNFNTTTEILNDSKIRILAVSVATSMLEEASSKSFDEQTDTAAVASISSLTAVSSLGLDGSENSSNHRTLNDFDDYNAYKTTPILDSISILKDCPKIVFKIFCKVDYVSSSSPSVVSTTRTWHKKMQIKVTSSAMGTDTIKMNTIYSYWYFR